MTNADYRDPDAAEAERIMCGPAIITFRTVKLAEANELLTRWDHPLGPCHRPFGSMSNVLVVDGEPVAVTVAASIVSPTVDSYARRQVVELARIGRAPEARWALRPTLRLWRAVLAHRWPYWPVEAAVSYALPGTPGDIYRFDGWRRVKECKPARPGKSSTWSRPSASDQIGDGRKTLWIFEYPITTEALA